MASVPTTAWNESSPAGSDNVSSGDDRIREMKTQIREVIDVDHDFPSSGNAADNGQHKKVTLQEQANLGTGAEGVPILGAQTVDGKAELLFTDEDDNDVQITSGGNIDGASVRLDNNESLTATDNAGTGTVSLIKANTSDQAEVTPVALLAAGAILPETSAPITAANQGALFTKNDGTQTELYFVEESSGDEVQITDGGIVKQTSFGAWTSKSNNTVYQADTDGFVVAYAQGSNAAIIKALTDGSNPPTTILAWDALGETNGAETSSITLPVRKDDYWKIEATGTTAVSIYWLPIS